jgi:hypothetical protein
MTGPLLIDRFVAQGKNLFGGPMPNNLIRSINQARHNAQRFLFSPEASETVGDFMTDCGDLILANRQFALPPYETCYVEFDAASFFANAKNQDFRVPFNERDKRLGYLNIGRNVYVFFADDNPAASVGMTYWKYIISPTGEAPINNVAIDLGELVPQFENWLREHPSFDHLLTEEDDTQRYSKYQAAFLLNLYLGATTPISNAKEYGQALKILNEVSMRWIVPSDHQIRKQKLTGHTMQGFYGDIRNYWALMLWLNQPNRTHMVGIPAGRKLVRGKLLPYLRYNVVSLDMGKAKTVRRAFTLAMERQSPVGHDVRAHWAHRGGFRHCFNEEGHLWPEQADEDGYFICSACKLKRWRVKEHHRGNSGEGWVNKHYEIAC